MRPPVNKSGRVGKPAHSYEENCDCEHPATGCVNPLPLCEPDGNVVLTDGQIKGRSAWPEPLEPEALIGLYEGGRYRWRGVYRPQLRCRMRSGDDTEGSDNTMQFCIVCREHLTAQLLHGSKLAGARIPEASELTYTDEGGAIAFSLSIREFADPLHPVEIVWKVNDVEQTGSADSPTFTLNISAEETDDFVVTATIHDQTPWIHPASVGKLWPLTLGKVLSEVPVQVESWTLRRDGI